MFNVMVFRKKYAQFREINFGKDAALTKLSRNGATHYHSATNHVLAVLES